MMKKTLNNFFLFALITMLVGCSNWNPTRTTRVYERPVILHPPKPDPANIRDVEWKVWNRESLEKVLEESDPNDKKFSFFVLDAKNYENLSLNMQEIIRYIEEENAIIRYYQETIPSIDSLTEVSEEEPSDSE